MREALHARICALVDRFSGGQRDDDARDRLLNEVLAWQRTRIPVLQRLGSDRAVPTDVFRHTRVAGHAPSEDVRRFLTSGTTHGTRGTHALCDLSLYDRAARSAAAHALFRGLMRPRLVMLAPRPDDRPESSLSYMLGRFERWFGGDTRWVMPGDRVDIDALKTALEGVDAPVVVLGTSFAFVHAEDALGDARFTLPSGSRLMQTGGFKGRSREVAPDALRAALAARYRVPESHVIAEYGMTELSSQMYEDTLLGGEGPRRLWVPGWVRTTVVDPERLRPLDDGEVGLLRIDDLANLDSVAAIQTSDLAIQHGDRIELLGRAPGAVPRGCSLAIEEALATEPSS
ncbi:MAG: acyl-protein synthetase [Sandaracinaceae bacterium]